MYQDQIRVVQGKDMICTRARYALYKGRISVLNGILFLLFSTYDQAKAKQNKNLKETNLSPQVPF